MARIRGVTHSFTHNEGAEFLCVSLEIERPSVCLLRCQVIFRRKRDEMRERRKEAVLGEGMIMFKVAEAAQKAQSPSHWLRLSSEVQSHALVAIRWLVHEQQLLAGP